MSHIFLDVMSFSCFCHKLFFFLHYKLFAVIAAVLRMLTYQELSAQIVIVLFIVALSCVCMTNFAACNMRQQPSMLLSNASILVRSKMLKVALKLKCVKVERSVNFLQVYLHI